MTIDNDKICPEDMVRVLMTASMVPDNGIVTKRTGEQEYTLKRRLSVYHLEHRADIEGLFLLGPRGSISQVREDTLLHWHVTAEDLVDTLRRSWEGTPR